MIQENGKSQFSKKRIIVFIISLITAAFWFAVQIVDVYHFAVVGAIFELLWLPMIAALIIVPIYSTITLIKEGFQIRSLYFYSILIIAALVIWLSFFR